MAEAPPISAENGALHPIDSQRLKCIKSFNIRIHCVAVLGPDADSRALLRHVAALAAELDRKSDGIQSSRFDPHCEFIPLIH